MPARIRRTFWASGAAASATAGRIRWRRLPEPKAGSKPAELHREEQDQHQPEPEARHRLEKERRDAARVVGGAVLVGGRDDAERDGEHGREHDGGRGQLHRGRPEVLEDHAAWPGGARGWTCRSRRAGTAAQEVEILHVASGAVEAERAARARRPPRGWRVWSTRNGGGIAGEPDEEEDDGDDAPHHEDGVDEPPQQEAAHRGPATSAGRRRGSPCAARTAAWKRTHAGAQRVDLDLLVQRDHRRPVAHLALEVGEEREPLLRRRPRGAWPCRASAAPADTAPS